MSSTMTSQTNQTTPPLANDLVKIGELHEHSWGGLWQIIKVRSLYKKKPFLASLGIGVLAALALAFKPASSFTALQSLTDLTTSVFPNLLGFSLGGYAIIVGFSNGDLMKRASKKNKHSLFQVLSGVFATVVLVQVLTVVVAFLLSWLIKLDLNVLLGLKQTVYGRITNLVILAVLLALGLYSLALMPYVVINIFSLSQTNNSFYTIEQYKEERAATRRMSNTQTSTTQPQPPQPGA